MKTKLFTEKEKEKEKLFFRDLTLEQRKVLRETINKIIECDKKQLALFDKIFINPLRKKMRSSRMLLNDELSIKHYVLINKKWSDWIVEFFKSISKK